MTRLTTRSHQRGRAGPARSPRAPDRRRPLAAVLADPRIRLGAGTTVILVTARAARRDRVSPAEVTAFRAINGLPDSIHLPAWATMQLGTVGAAPVAAAVAWLSGERRLAGLR